MAIKTTHTTQMALTNPRNSINKQHCSSIAKRIQTIKTIQTNPRSNTHNQDYPAVQTNPQSKRYKQSNPIKEAIQAIKTVQGLSKTNANNQHDSDHSNS